MTTLTVTDQRTTPLATTRNHPPAEPKRARVRGKLAEALHLMVWEGMPFDEAARNVNLTARAMRKALAKPHVIAHLKHERDVFRASISAKNIHRAAEIRDQNDNKQAALNAISLLERLGEDESAARSGPYRFAPGVTIVIGADAAHIAHVRGNEAKPLIEHEPVSQDDGEQA